MITCKKCASEYEIPSYWLDSELKAIIEEGYCPWCAYWEYYLRKYGNNTPANHSIFWISIDGVLYLLNKRYLTLTSIKGVNFEWQLIKPVYYVLMDRGYASVSGNLKYTTNNLINIGKIPKEYLPNFPSNARFITRQQYYLSGSSTLED